MKRIGIISENYDNDSQALKVFLTPQYKGKVEFILLGKSLNGGEIPPKKIINTIPIEVVKNKIDGILFARDLDEEANLTQRTEWFVRIEKNLNTTCIFFLAVMELEALILADINTFNSMYGIKGQYKANPMFNLDPKQELQNRTSKNIKAKRQYKENDAKEIFNKLDFDIVRKNHTGNCSFNAFIEEFEKKFEL